MNKKKRPRSSEETVLPKWKLAEHAVKLLEESLDPHAQVTHNEWLIEAVTKNRRQCDVVIRSSSPGYPRLTIVEVQDRAKKVDISFLEGWISKADKLDADCLVCVSVMGFTDSAEREASLHGDKIRLMTLCDTESFPDFCRVRSVPIVFSDGIDEKVVIDRPASSKPEKEIRNSAKVYLCEALAGIVSVEDIVRAYQADARMTVLEDRKQQGKEEIRIQIHDLGQEGWQTRFVAGGEDIPVRGVFIVTRYAVRTVEFPLTILAYERQLLGGVVSWIATASIRVANEERLFRMTFTPQEGGDITVTMAPPTLPQGFNLESINFEVEFPPA